MIRNLFFKSLQVCFALVLFFCLTACDTVDVYVHNQTQDNISLGLTHVMNGETKFMGMISAGREERWTISRSYGDLAILNILCPQDLDFLEVIEDTVVITEPERDRFQASAQSLIVSISDLYE